MTGIFGEVADVYDEVRPGYPAELGAAILDYHGGVPSAVVEIGAGTGKGTQVLLGLGAPVTCVEPDPRMAAVLTARFPGVRVHAGTFEQWSPPDAGVPLIACAMAWHFLDPATRNDRVHDGLVPGGTLAVFGHRYDYADLAHGAAVMAAFRTVDPQVRERPVDWFERDIADSGRFTDLRVLRSSRHLELSTARYLQLVQTFSPFRRQSPDRQAQALAVVASVLDDRGGSIVLDLRTTLVLARRPRPVADQG